MKMKDEDAEMFVRDPVLGNFFDTVRGLVKDPILATNYIASDVAGMRIAETLEDDLLIQKETAASFADLMGMISEKKISSRVAKDLLPRVLAGEDPETIVMDEGLTQTSDVNVLENVARTVIDSNKKVVADYKGGKESALQFLVGQGMKMTKGSANPEELRTIFLRLLS